MDLNETKQTFESFGIMLDTFCWENAAKHQMAEEALVAAVLEAIKKEKPPCKFRLSPDGGFRVFVYTDPESTEIQRHSLTAWLVRHFGRMTRGVRDTGKPFFVTDNMPDGRIPGWPEKWISPVILQENAALGKCRIVEEEKLVKIKRLICDDEVVGMAP